MLFFHTGRRPRTDFRLGTLGDVGDPLNGRTSEQRCREGAAQSFGYGVNWEMLDWALDAMPDVDIAVQRHAACTMCRGHSSTVVKRMMFRQ
jgi:hypothetical protein